ncbi:MAG TPA: glycoside hydrolase, partial [Edaphobacter sp.]|nr:glycoside hydrolase [Edaphobacter sp.]
VVDNTPGDVLIAGLDDAHRTEVTLDGVTVEGIKPEQVHGRFATVTAGAEGTNLDFRKTEIKIIAAKRAAVDEEAYNCDGRFVPMQ